MASRQQPSIGISVKAPDQKCSDDNCPFHGKLSVRGRLFTGSIVSGKMTKTVVIEFDRLHFLKKYERYEKRRTKLKAHNPECINAKEGDVVKVMECRPLSKTKSFVIIESVGKEKGFIGKMEARESAKVADKLKKEETEESDK